MLGHETRAENRLTGAGEYCFNSIVDYRPSE